MRVFTVISIYLNFSCPMSYFDSWKLITTTLHASPSKGGKSGNMKQWCNQTHLVPNFVRGYHIGWMLPFHLNTVEDNNACWFHASTFHQSRTAIPSGLVWPNLPCPHFCTWLSYWMDASTWIPRKKKILADFIYRVLQFLLLSTKKCIPYYHLPSHHVDCSIDVCTRAKFIILYKSFLDQIY